MTLLEKIRTAKTKHDLMFLTMEIILSKDYKENLEEFKRKDEELRNEAQVQT